MSNANLAKQRYGAMQKELRSDKSVERLIFGKITSALQAADPKQPGGMTELAEAVTKNTKLWNLILVDLVHPNNRLPLSLKKNLIGLAEFVQSHSIRVLSGDATHYVLVDVNKSIMAGLAGVTKPVIQLDHDVEVAAA